MSANTAHVVCGRRVVIRTLAVSAPNVYARSIGSVGGWAVVVGGRFEAAEHGVDALSTLRGRGVVIERTGLHASFVEALAVFEGGHRSVIIRVGMHAPENHRRAAAILKGRRRVKRVEAAVCAAPLDARAVVHHGEGAVVERSACGAAARRGRRRRRRRRRGWRRQRWWVRGGR